jgi:NAD(P)H-dependent flavin oxidoreductase YrpB (nitropropane dioxygenase family)
MSAIHRSLTQLPFCRQLGIDYPIFSVGMGAIAAAGAGVAALSLGAQAVSLGTRFLCGEDTVYTTLFDLEWADAPHRVLRNKVVAEWEAAGRPPSGQRPGEGSIIGTVPRGETTVDLVRYSACSCDGRLRGSIPDARLDGIEGREYLGVRLSWSPWRRLSA